MLASCIAVMPDAQAATCNMETAGGTRPFSFLGKAKAVSSYGVAHATGLDAGAPPGSTRSVSHRYTNVAPPRPFARLIRLKARSAGFSVATSRASFAAHARGRALPSLHSALYSSHIPGRSWKDRMPHSIRSARSGWQAFLRPPVGFPATPKYRWPQWSQHQFAPA